MLMSNLELTFTPVERSANKCAGCQEPYHSGVDMPSEATRDPSVMLDVWYVELSGILGDTYSFLCPDCIKEAKDDGGVKVIEGSHYNPVYEAQL